MAIQETRLLQTEERLSQVRGGLFPTVSLLGSYQRQDQPAEAGNAFNRPDQSTIRLNLLQPIFRGMREYSEWRASERDTDSQRASVDQAKLSLYAQVARSYFQTLQAEHDLKNLESLYELTEQRAKDLSSRVKIGRSRRGELLTSQAQSATLLASIEAAKSQIEQTREELTALTGLPAATELEDKNDPPPASIEPIATYLEQVEKRPDIAAQRTRESAALERIDTAWGGHLPSIDFSGNYYFRRTGILENVAWDINLTLTVPLFQGGIVSAQVREANEKHKEQSLLLAQLRRNAQKEIRTFHVSLTRGISQLTALKSALETAEENYKEQTRDYRYGLVTNLDVLQALNTFQETKRQLDRVYFETKQNEVSLNAAIGKI